MKRKEGYVGKSAYQNLEVRTARPSEATLPRKASRIILWCPYRKRTHVGEERIQRRAR